MKHEIRRYENLQDLSRAAAVFICKLAKRCVTHGVFTIALSGGKTPRTLYELLAEPPFESMMPWKDTHFFWGDERCVPPDNLDSNLFTAYQALISRVHVPSQNIHRIPAEVEPQEEAAEAYERILHDFFGQPRKAGRCLPSSAESKLFSSFDLILLGVGEDGHTASLFPDDQALEEKERWVAVANAPNGTPPLYRLTLTLAAINTARCALFLVSGSGKKEVVRAILDNHETARRLYPAARVNPRGQVVWFMDNEFV
ncbi:MAG: 6-phosphogluconolactonase [Candidatus Hydrogenedentota bacterium]|nr:MAG: 6-phosphogluconolactonase [Candidatus Hydrogenedentota bacterium]